MNIVCEKSIVITHHLLKNFQKLIIPFQCTIEINIKILATELYKILNGLSPEIMKEVFPFNENTSYNTRNKRKFHQRAIKSVTFGSETLSHMAPKIWELVPVEIKNVELVACFKSAIKKWKPINSPCRLCRTYVFQVRFV